MPAGDKQQYLPVKKLALRDLSNETRNTVDMSQGHFSGHLKISGVKRHCPDYPQSSHLHSTCASTKNGLIVYVRRKLEGARKTNVPCTVGASTNSLSMMESNSSMFAAAPLQANSPSACDEQWKERYLRLQNFLHYCDRSNQEEYMQMLRSLSAVDRSKHAIELEKRAISLLLKEGTELGRMKLLNVLGKVPPS